MVINPFESSYIKKAIILDQFGKRINTHQETEPLVEVGYESEEAKIIQTTKENATPRDLDYLGKNYWIGRFGSRTRNRYSPVRISFLEVEKRPLVC